MLAHMLCTALHSTVWGSQPPNHLRSIIIIRSATLTLASRRGAVHDLNNRNADSPINELCLPPIEIYLFVVQGVSVALE